MPTLTFKVPIKTVPRLERLAARRHLTKSAVIREALDEKLGGSTNASSLDHMMRSSIGGIDSGVPDLGHNPRHLEGFGKRSQLVRKLRKEYTDSVCKRTLQANDGFQLRAIH